MIPDDVLMTISNRLAARSGAVGWIFPDGSVVLCETHEHYRALPAEYQDRYAELLEIYKEEMYAELDSLGPDEHPAMHRFDPENDTARELLREIAQKGFLRLGVWRQVDGLKIELDGQQDGVRLHHDVIAYMVAALNVSDVYLGNSSSYNYRRVRQKQF